MMPDTKLPTPTMGVPIELGGKTYHLRYSLKTRRKFREDVGQDILSANVMGDLLAKLLMYGLLDDDPGMTEERVEELVDLEHIADVVDALSEATGTSALLKMFPPGATEELAEAAGQVSVPPKDPQPPTSETDVGQEELPPKNDDEKPEES